MNNKIVYLIIAGMIISSCQSPQDTEERIVAKAPHYPETRKDTSVVDNYFGTQVSDPYRWLEDDHAEETKEWVKAQNEVTFSYLEQIPFRSEVRNRIEDLWDYEKIYAPKKEGGKYYYFRNDGLQNQNVLYVTDDPEQEGRVFLDPNKFSKDGTKSLTTSGFSSNGKLFAYSVSTAGSDWNEIFVMDAVSGKQLEDKIEDVKFSGISWKGNEGFYYSSYDRPKEGSQFSGITQYHKLFYHKLGTPQSEDELIFGGEKTPRRYIEGYVTKDDQYLIITAAQSTSGGELYFQDLTRAGSKIVPIVTNFENDHEIIHSFGDKLYIHTNLNALNNRIVEANVKNPAPENWKDIIPEKDMVLSAGSAGNKIFATYLEDAKSLVEQYDLQGKLERKIALPGIGTATGFSGEADDKEIYYTFTSFTTPASVYRYELASGKSELFKQPKVKFDPQAFETKQIFYNSKDGTRVPMFITHKKGLELNGKNPAYLYAYGGFNVSMTPAFNPATIAWLENGGIYVVPNLRGGGEYGKKWHLAGTKLQKQNVFDDFIAAAEYLIENNYTSSQYLAIAGGSNGGLLVGATMAQRPELAKVAFPAVGVMDMLRYHKFTAGAGWAFDYGTADESKEMFEYLRGYSPVHALRSGVSYPATLVTTADHDDRVVPAHSFKFAATLQEKQVGDAPVLIRIETDAGHGAGKPTSKVIDEIADRYSFAWYIMGNSPVSEANNNVQARK